MFQSKRALIALLWIPMALIAIGWSSGGSSHSATGTTALPPPPTTGSTGVPATATSTTSTSTTSTTGTSSTTSTTGTSPSTTGSGAWSGHVYLHKLYEVQSVPTSYRRLGSAVSTLANQHVVQVRIVLPSQTVSPPYELVGVSHDVSVFGDAVLVSRSDGGAAPVYQAAVPRAPLPNSSPEAAITYFGITAPGYVDVGLAATGPLSGGDLRMTIVQTAQTRQWVNGQWQYQNGTSHTYLDLDLAKLACDDASVDSRRGYGQPNLAGEYPGDANAPPRPVNFGGWNFRGGLFLGNMPAATGDQSGMARAQLYVPSGGQGTVRLATLSLYDFGSPANAYGVSLGVYLPSATDPNLNVGEGAVTWDSKWSSILPRDTAASPPDDARDPVRTLILTGAGGSFCNLPLQRDDALPPSMALSRICLAMTEEDVNDGPYWRYFGSKEYGSGFSSFPANDCAPRVWRLGEQSVVTW